MCAVRGQGGHVQGAVSAAAVGRKRRVRRQSQGQRRCVRQHWGRYRMLRIWNVDVKKEFTEKFQIKRTDHLQDSFRLLVL